jgi:hypothetical protein
MQPRMAVLLGSSIALVLVLTGCGGGDLVEVPPLPIGRQIATSTSAAPVTTPFAEPSAIDAPAALPDAPSADTNGYVEADVYRTDFEGYSQYQFKSPTGALSCEINSPYEPNESSLMTMCQVHGRDGAGPGEQCNDSNATGAVLHTSDVGFFCGPTGSGSSYTVLEYGNKIKVGLFECISERSGITCNYSGLPSFKVAREGVILAPLHIDPSPFRHLEDDTYYYPFRSPTGALSCSISAPAPWNKWREYQPASAFCDVADRAGSDAHYACDWDDATGALLFATGAQFTCHATGASNVNARVLEYGQTLAVEGFECTSERTGITCHNGAPGFKVAREGVSLY